MGWIEYAVVVGGFIATCITVNQLQSRLQRSERKLNALLRHFNIDMYPQLSDHVKELAKDPKQKIHAIKLFREETGVSLVEAKEAVEAFINSK